MARVYRAQDHLGQVVALKMLHNSATATQAARLEREGELAGRLSHPNVLSLVKAGSFGGQPYLAFELVEGARELDEAFVDLERKERVELVIQVAAGVAHAHEAGVVHRDLKPSNVLVDRGGFARVADFGVGAGDAVERMTRTGVLVGTPQYMAPEQIQGNRELWGPHSDVWALGVILYEALTETAPFGGSSLIELSVSIVQSEPTPPRSLDRSVPKALEEVCLRALSKDPRARFANAREFSEALDLAALSGVVTSPTRRRAGLGTLGVGVGICVLLLAGIVGAALLAAAPEPSPSPTPSPKQLSLAEREAELERAVDSLRKSERGEEARALLLSTLKAEPENGLAWELLGDLDVLPDPVRAVESYRRSLEIRPTANGYAGCAIALHRSGDSEAGLVCAAKGLALDPRSANAYRKRALIQFESGHPEEALEDVENSLELEPGDSESLNTKGLALHALGRLDEAEAMFRASLAGDRNPSGLRNLGICLSARGDHAEGVKLLEEAVKMSGEDAADILMGLGVTHLNRDLPQDALEAFERAVEFGSEDPELRFYRGVARNRVGDLAGAKLDLKRYLELSEGGRYRTAAMKLLRRLEAAER
jgi:tetratricopeptide (TPR) repeat protein